MWSRHGDKLAMSDQRCQGRDIPASGPLPETSTQGCGGQCRVKFHYFDSVTERLLPVELCAVCDRVYDMPRFL